MKVIEYCKGKKNIYIYGAGVRGQRLLRALTACNINITGFIVSDGEDYHAEVLGKPVDNLSSIKGLLYDAGVLIAVSDKYRDAVKEQLREADLGSVAYLMVENKEIQELTRTSYPLDISKLLASTTPVSRAFGFDRGTPLDRVYIERFLNKAIKDISIMPSSVLEVGDNKYSKMLFGSSKAQLDILDYSSGEDLTKIDTLPCEKYDVFICTQVLNYIYDVRKAIAGMYQVLKPGGVLLCTVAGNIAQVSKADYIKWGDYWRFTDMSINKLFVEMFGENIEVESFGNAAVATAFIQGLCAEELPDNLLWNGNDSEYAIIHTIKAVKRGGRNA